MSPRRTRLRFELPLLIGVIAALGLLAPLLVGPVDGPAGSDAGQYLYSAEYIWTRSPEGKYYDWRKPFHPYLLGLLGNHVGFVIAGAWIARAAVALTVVEAALFARLLAGPWAGGVAALGLVWLPMVGPSTAWTNLYPLLGAACGLAVVGAAWAALRPGPAATALTAAAAGVALLVDGRAASVALPCVLAAGLSVAAAGPWLRRAVGLGALTITFAGFVRLDAALYDTLRVPRLPLAQAVEKQRHIAADARGVSAPRGPADPSVAGPPAGGAPRAAPPISAVAAACDGAEPEILGWGALLSPCAEATRAESLVARVESRDLPPVALLPLLAAALLPAGLRPEARRPEGAGAGPIRPFALSWEARALLTTVLLYGGAVASLWAAAGLAPLPDRYLAPYLVLLAALGPIAAARLAGRVARLSPARPGLGRPLLERLAPALGGMLALGLASTWTGAHRPAGPTRTGDDRSLRAGAAWIRTTLRPGDRLYDCTGLDLAVVLLPDRPRAGRCPSELLTHPEDAPDAPTEGRAWLVARQHAGPGRPTAADTAVEALLGARGWVPVAEPPDAPSLSFWSAPSR